MLTKTELSRTLKVGDVVIFRFENRPGSEIQVKVVEVFYDDIYKKPESERKQYGMLDINTSQILFLTHCKGDLIKLMDIVWDDLTVAGVIRNKDLDHEIRRKA